MTVDPLDFDIDYSTSDSDGVEARMAAIFGASTGRTGREELHPTLGEDGWAALLEEKRAEGRANLTAGRMKLSAANWIVTATT